ncbi:MAG: hypothetical protein M3203_07165, partial [Actinomycetota bacterium]|nr:hypothetical protein [Actinomycetota bacterium]
MRTIRVGRSPGVITCLYGRPAAASDARARTYSSHQLAAMWIPLVVFVTWDVIAIARDHWT